MNNISNQLGSETSPYLLQHADNPVNWHAWNAAALEIAKQENKPILLSIGYSACHWCHVMAHESFEDKATASIMNAHFINIKIDREERPDLDKIYQTAHSILTGRSGGWPLTVFLSPEDQMPFFAGTYFPKQPRYGMPAFCDLLQNIIDIFKNRFDDITQQNVSLREMLSKEFEPTNTDAILVAMPLDMARRQLLAAFDTQHGGFSQAPKFPHPLMLERALRQWCLTHTGQDTDEAILNVALFSLTKMTMGGVFDHIGGGFCRYSTDNYWMIPHFEKMLYDNGQLLPLYYSAWQLTGDKLYSNTIERTANWVMHEMQSPQGGYYSAQDADSEGEEGKFYVWTQDDIKSQLNGDDYKIFCVCYGLDKPANFEHRWHLHQYHTTAELAEIFNTSIDNIYQSLSGSRKKLYAARALRIAPGTDDKILTSWNSLMIRGMCFASRLASNTPYLNSARKALDFIQHNMWRNKRLLATSKNGKTHLNAYLDDYASLVFAILEFLQCHWDNSLYNWAIEIADALIENFEDTNHGGFFFTSHDHEKLIQRSKTFSDDAMPSGNGMASLVLQRLGLLAGNTQYLSVAERCLQAASPHLNQHAVLHCGMLNTLEDYLNLPVIIILRGEKYTIDNWLQKIHHYYLPRTLCFAIPNDVTPPTSLAEKISKDIACAYICEGTHCLPPVTSLAAIIKYLQTRNPHINRAHGNNQQT